MSQMNTTPVFKCRRCGMAVIVSHLSTTHPDPDGHVLTEMMSNLAKVALCAPCQSSYNYYASQGRSDEFYAASSGILIAERK